ncbi:hypothetical protein ACP70R_030630 [Stipagrostis hirtigluma subsp. patula]
MEPQPGSPTSPSPPSTPSSGRGSAEAVTAPFEEMAAPDEPEEEVVALEPDRQSTSSSSSSSSSSSAGTPSRIAVVELGKPLLPAPEDEQAVVGAAEVKPDDWAACPPEQPPGSPQAVDDPLLSVEQPPGSPQAVDDPLSSVGGAAWPPEQQPGSPQATAGLTQAPEVQTMPKVEDAPAAAGPPEFDPDRIPASIFHPRTSSAQADWSVASNESLFSIQGASQPGEFGGLYSGSRSHFDYFYDEAMAAAAGAEGDSKLPPLAEGFEPGDFAMPGSAGSDASPRAKKAAAFRRHENGSSGSSSNFSFAFPILAETSPKKRDAIIGSALYQPLEKEYEQPAPEAAPPKSAFEEMTTEEERRNRTGWWCCGECCGCCWFACSWRSCCCCCQWQWWRCSCGCCRGACPSFCRCNWCLCF